MINMASSCLEEADQSAYPPPTLTLSKSILRPWCSLDHKSLVHAANNPNIARSLRNRFPSPYTQADAEWWITHAASEPFPKRSLAIVNPTTNEVIGGIGLELGTDVACRTAELGYWLSEEYWGRGIMGEAARAFVEYGFRELKVGDKDGNELGIWRIVGECYAHNKGSTAVLEKAGLGFERLVKGNVRKDGKVVDSLSFYMTRDEWEKKERK